MGSKLVETGAGNRTVEEIVLGATGLLTEVAKQATALGKSTLSSGVTWSGSALSEALLLYWHSQAMAELSQLLFWLERNDYARSLTVSVICASYAHISLEIMKLIDLISLTLDYAETLGMGLEPPPEVDYDIEQAHR